MNFNPSLTPVSIRYSRSSDSKAPISTTGLDSLTAGWRREKGSHFNSVVVVVAVIIVVVVVVVYCSNQF